MLARAVVATAAVLVLAWLGVMERDVRLRARGNVVHDFARAEADLRAARLLNPDTGPDLERALLYLGADRPREAAAVLEGIVRAEPDNLAAWGALYNVSRTRDPAAVRRALDARRRLDPLRAPRP